MSGTLTAVSIRNRILELSLNGVCQQLCDGRVLHVVYDGAVFVIATDVDAFRAVGETLAGEYEDVFIVFLHPLVAEAMNQHGCRHEQYVAVRALHGTDDLNCIRVNNHLPGPLPTQRGTMQLLISLAEDLNVGDIYGDGTGDRGSLAIYTAGPNTKNEYLPGRLVFKRADWGNA